MSSTAPVDANQRKLRTLLGDAWWAIVVTWKTSRSISLGLIVVTLLRGVVPAGVAIFARELINTFVASSSQGADGFSAVLPWLVFGFVFTVIDGTTPFAFQFMLRRLGDDINLNVSNRILRHAAKLELTFFEDPEHRRIIELARQDTAERFTGFVSHLLSTITGLLQSTSLIVVLAYIEPLILVVVAPFGVAYLVFKWRLSQQSYTQQYTRTPRRRWTGYFVSLLTGWNSVGEVKMLGLSDVLIGRFNKLMEGFRDEDRRLHQRGFVGAGFFAVATTTALFLVFGWLLFRALRGGATVGDIAVFGASTSRLRVTLEVAITSVSRTMEQTLHIANLRRFLSIQPRMAASGKAAPPESRGEVELKNVTFTYPGAGRPTLKDVSLHIQPGEIVGVVGETGAGKSTLVKVICRLYDPEQGVVKFDGRDVRDLSLEHLHGKIGFLMQGFSRFEATAAENIAYGDWRRLHDDKDQVAEVAQRANVHDMITGMPEGYDTMLGRLSGAMTLSGGQWQKLALARGFARNASLLILDEPTSNLDARAEHRLFHQFRDLAKGRTTLLISHRFSTLRLADRIVVMNAGQIVESGTHQELLERRGAYFDLYDLYRHQFDQSPADGALS